MLHAELEKVCGKLCSLWSAFNMQDLRFGCELEAPSEDLCAALELLLEPKPKVPSQISPSQS